MSFNAREFINAALFSDAHKDAYGFRPSSGQYARWSEMSEAQLIAERDALYAAVERSIDDDARQHAEAARLFEIEIADLIATGAGDRETALRWMLDAEGISDDEVAFYGMGQLEYSKGLKFGTIPYERRVA